MRLTTCLVLAPLVTGLTPAAAQGPDQALVAKGEQLATIWCSACHLTGTANQTSALADAIPFATLATDPNFDNRQLAFALYNPHPAMPAFNVTREEVRALGAYIRTLAPIADRDQVVTDIEVGREIARENCARCHAIEGDRPGDDEQAPAFATFSRQWPIDNLAEALAEGIVVGHNVERMPEFTLDPVDIEALLAYITSVQRSSH